MILAAHVIISAYGFWLPNDPRGSWSRFVASWELYRYGPATKVTTRQSVAGVPHNAALRAAAKSALRYPPVIFSDQQIHAIGEGFAQVVKRTGCVIHACAILPDHVHLVLARHHYRLEQLTNLLKGGATRQLTVEGLHPMASYSGGRESLPTPWGKRFWVVYIDNPAHLQSAVAYVNRNPIKEGRSPQQWDFITRPGCS